MWVREVLFIILVNLVAICHVKRNVILASQELGEIDIKYLIWTKIKVNQALRPICRNNLFKIWLLEKLKLKIKIDQNSKKQSIPS